VERLYGMFEEEIEAGTFPGAVLLVGDSRSVRFQHAYGYRALKPEREENTIDTIYDLASLTKVIATTPAVMKLIEDGQIRLYDPVKLFIDEFAQEGKQDIRIFHLLTHTSGLPSYSEAWRYAKGKDLLKHINNTKLINPVGEKFIYSCLNFITLMEIVENVAKVKFDEFVKREIFKPIGMVHTTFNPPEEWIPKIAPTSERDGHILRGGVDDELANYLGGVSGNAGLFSNAEDLYRYARVFMNRGMANGHRIFSDATIEAFTKESFNDSCTRRALGWDMVSISCSCGDLMSDSAYGHTGFTGTSIWIDPELDIVIILLANRVHVERWANQIQLIRFRPRLHNYVVSHREELT